MRISEDRYTHELQSIDIALRFIKHQARTQTIREWTGLSGDRIRSLHHTYVRPSPEYVPRPRGRSPHQLAQFMRSARQQDDTTILVRMLSLLGAVPPAPGMVQLDANLPDTARAHLICFGYEMYRAQSPDPLYSFEHAIFLTKTLINSNKLLLDNCFECTGLVISEQFTKGLRRCSYCGTR
jgi:Flagellar transcriptional activator (FlhC)